MENTIPLQPVKSSNIAALGYDAATQTLAVQFKTGSTYHYSGVPPELYAEFTAAQSLGKFFGAMVAGRFQTTKLKPVEEAHGERQ